MPVGNLLSVGVLALIASLLNENDFLSWGWRVPFLMSAILVFVGLWMRARIDESPEFEALAVEGKVTSHPLRDLIRGYPQQLVIACCIRIWTNVTFYIFTLFVLTFVSTTLGLDKGIALRTVLIASAIQISSFPGLLPSPRRQTVFLIGSIGAALWGFPFFSLIQTKDPRLITGAICVAVTLWALMYGPLAAFITELFLPMLAIAVSL